MSREKLEGWAYLLAFTACIPAANWLIGNWGTVCPPNSPCLIPVGPNLMAPSGVPMIGLALVLRDLVQRRLGARWAIAAILAGAALSAGLAPAQLVIASGTAFLLSELADFAVYTPLQKKRLITAVIASGIVGLLIDSALFLYLAFGVEGLNFFAGQAVGKAWMIVLALPFIWWLRENDRRRQIEAA